MDGPSPQVALKPCTFAEIAGWQDGNHALALAAFCRSASVMQSQFSTAIRHPLHAGIWEDWKQACDAAPGAADAQGFFEHYFTPCRAMDSVRPEGLFTGYYEPLAEGSLTQSPEYPVPIYAKPEDLVAFGETIEHQIGLKYGRMVDGHPRAYFTRREIEQGALQGRGLELLWLRSWEDAFFIQVQGSGRVRLANGQELRLTYAAKSGLPYTSIGTVLLGRGELRREELSMQALRAWMTVHPAEARELMWQNESFVFFRMMKAGSDDLGAVGAQHVNLTPHCSLAVDSAFWSYGTPVWLNLMAPTGDNAELEPFQNLMIAQDTGSAIKGACRGDVYWGWGVKAAMAAGHMKSPGEMLVLLPRPLVARLELA